MLDGFAGDERAMFMGVFDGHGPNGHHASNFVKERLPVVWAGAGKVLAVDPFAAMRRGCVVTNAELSASDIDVYVSGSTGISSFLRGNRLYVANVGDSRAVLGRAIVLPGAGGRGDAAAVAAPSPGPSHDPATTATTTTSKLAASSLLRRLSGGGGGGAGAASSPRGDAVHTAACRDGACGGACVTSAGSPSSSVVIRALDLSSDQKPDRPDEHARIMACGGRVFEWGVPRVWLAEVDMPGLAMSRSYGDAAAESVGVFAEPELSEVALGPSDKFVILASDGVWEFIGSQEAVDIVKEHLNGTPLEAAAALVKEAVRRWNEEEEVVDDTTAIVMVLRFPGPLASSPSRTLPQTQTPRQLGAAASPPSSAAVERIA